MTTRIGTFCLLTVTLLPVGAPVSVAAEQKTIVLIGGVKSEGPAQHDYPHGIQLLATFLENSPDVRAIGNLTAHAHPDGWPANPDAFAGAVTVVWYFDGLDKHPLLDAKRRTEFAALMQRGVGLVALHQSFTLPADDRSIDLQRWLGGVRYGMFDRTTEMVRYEPARHPVMRGVATFTYHDEFYPTIRFATGAGRVTPLLTGKLHPQFREGQNLVIDRPQVSAVGWTFEREGGGRSFAFSGAHYLVTLDEPQVRRMLLNAILWTAGLEVPAQGVRSAPADAATTVAMQARRAAEIGGARTETAQEAVVTRPADNKVVEFPWGHLTWYASRELGNSQTMTVGEAVIRPGQQNPRHYHPNCDEVLHVVRGHILHSMGDRTVEMRAGDTVTIPTGVLHNARNLGTEDAVLAISFSSADRQVVNE